MRTNRRYCSATHGVKICLAYAHHVRVIQPWYRETTFQVDQPTVFTLERNCYMSSFHPLVDTLSSLFLFKPLVPFFILRRSNWELPLPQAGVTLCVPCLAASWPPGAEFAKVQQCAHSPFQAHHFGVLQRDQGGLLNEGRAMPMKRGSCRVRGQCKLPGES